jgi:hypothetical protein
VKFPSSAVLSIDGNSIGTLTMQRIWAALGHPDQYESTLFAGSSVEQRWIWSARRMSATLAENGEISSLVIDPKLTHLAVHGKSIPSTRSLFLKRFPKATPLEGTSCELTLGKWRFEVGFRPESKTATGSVTGGKINRITVRLKNR